MKNFSTILSSPFLLVGGFMLVGGMGLLKLAMLICGRIEDVVMAGDRSS